MNDFMNPDSYRLPVCFSLYPPNCKYCKGTTKILPGNPVGVTLWCCQRAKEDAELEIDRKEIERLTCRGYTVIKNEKGA